MIIQFSEKVWYISKIDMYQLPSQCLKKSKVCACKSGVFLGLKDLGILRSRSPPKYGIYDPISILIYIWDLNWSKSIEIDLNRSRSWKDLRSAKHWLYYILETIPTPKHFYKIGTKGIYFLCKDVQKKIKVLLI